MKITTVAIGILIVALAGCSQVHQNDKVTVVVSILPQKAFVKAVGGEFVNVQALIPPGGSPETYDPKPSDLALVEKADIYFRIGYIPFEKSHMRKFAQLNPHMKIIDTSSTANLRYFGSDNHTGVDPHIWLAPLQVKKQIDIIAQTLAQVDPVHAEIYKTNAEDYKKRLDALHAEIQAEFDGLKTKKLMVFHPAWGYFADEFGLEEIAIEQSGKEPTAKQLQQLIKEAKEKGINVIFVSPQFDKSVAQSLADEVGAVVVSIDPLSEEYINNLRNVAKTIAESRP